MRIKHTVRIAALLCCVVLAGCASGAAHRPFAEDKSNAGVQVYGEIDLGYGSSTSTRR